MLIGKPSISMGHLYHGHVSHNQRLDVYVSHFSPSIEVHGSPWFPSRKSMVVRLCIEILHDGTGSGADGDARLPLLRNAVESLASAGAGNMACGGQKRSVFRMKIQQ